jgi:hypothetical protein
MKYGLAIVVLTVAASASAQPKVYTNADLNKPLSTNRPSPSPEVLQGLAANQFRLAPHYDGPYVVGVFSSPTAGPFGEFWPQLPDQRFDGTLWSAYPFVLGNYRANGLRARSQTHLSPRRSIAHGQGQRARASRQR